MRSNLLRNFRITTIFSLILLLSISAATYMSMKNLIDNGAEVRKSADMVQTLERVLSDLKDAETGQRGFLLSNDTSFLEPYHNGTRHLITDIQRVSDLIGDNKEHRVNLDVLSNIIKGRLAIMSAVIEDFKHGHLPDIKTLRKGKTTMDSARQIINEMQDQETSLMTAKTERLNRSATYTPLLLIFSILVSFVLSLMSYVRLKNDLEKRVALQQELVSKSDDMARRIAIIETLAGQISNGEYKIRIDDKDAGELGSLATSLNQMAANLDESFMELENKRWIQEGLTKVDDTMRGENNLKQLAQNILGTLTGYLNADIATLYLVRDNILYFEAGHAITALQAPQKIAKGEGIAGKAAIDQKVFVTNEVDDSYFKVLSTTGEAKPAGVAVMPILYESDTVGVIELGRLSVFSPRDIKYMEQVRAIIAIGLTTTQGRAQIQLLLEETQAQSEELQVQQAELEIKTQSLQASEEELKVQQEELLQTNQTLEEKAQQMEERNQMLNEKTYELQMANGAVEDKNKQLEQANTYKSEFLANMSHELRTPLNSILLLSRLIAQSKKEDFTVDWIEYAQVINSAGNGLLTLINDILDLSKIEAGQMKLQIEDIQLAEVQTDLQKLFKPVADQKGVSFKIKISRDLAANILTDKLRLEQVLKNMLSNAFKFTEKGTITMDMKPETLNGVPAISFIVKDTGIGIPSDKLETIFEAFKQVDGSTMRKYGGTGLGLSISRQLANMLGGEIHAESAFGSGSTFYLTIPVETLVKAEDETEGETQEETVSENTGNNNEAAMPEETPANDDRDNLEANDHTILIVEDDLPFAQSLLTFLHSRNYKGILAGRGYTGLKLAEKYLPKGILLDIQLPVLNGWEVMQQLKENPLTRHIPVHIMSSLEARRESLDKGAVDFINKPLAFEQMDSMLNRIENALKDENKKVLIIEDQDKHAKALSVFLSKSNIDNKVAHTVQEGLSILNTDKSGCVILNTGLEAEKIYEILEEIKKDPAHARMPVIIYTSKLLAPAEEKRMKAYSETIIVHTADSYKRLLDEVTLFLHVVKQPQHTTPALKRNTALYDSNLSGKKVLVIDDDPRNLFTLKKALEANEMEIVTAASGQEGLEQIKRNPDVDIALIDIMMPGMDGHELIRILRASPDTKKIPIIVVTAKTMPEDRKQSIDAGASDYITKPIDLDQLLSLMRVWLY